QHDAASIERAAGSFRSLIDLAIKHTGSYYLTYHRYATRQQVESCYPQFAHFLELKRQYDPEGLFQSNWYRHYQKMFSLSNAKRPAHRRPFLLTTCKLRLLQLALACIHVQLFERFFDLLGVEFAVTGQPRESRCRNGIGVDLKVSPQVFAILAASE